MKSAALTYHKAFPETPISSWVGARFWAWKPSYSLSGQPMRPIRSAHPFLVQRPLWCRLDVHFNGIDLRFAFPQEVDHFLHVMEKNPLPSGHRLSPGTRIGRPMRHWLAKLPARAKSARFRKMLCDYLHKEKKVQDFRAFYAARPVSFDFPEVCDSFQAAHAAAFSS